MVDWIGWDVTEGGDGLGFVGGGREAVEGFVEGAVMGIGPGVDERAPRVGDGSLDTDSVIVGDVGEIRRL